MTTLKEALDIADDLMPFIEKAAHAAAVLNIPGVSPAAKIAEVIAQIADNALERVNDGVLVASTDDLATLKGIREKLVAENDALDRELDQMNSKP